jgi:hypothetical protein
MTATRQVSMTADKILAIHDDTVAMPVILSGVLDAKIAETRAAIADLASRQGIAQTMDQANKALADATALKAKAEQHLADAQVTAQKVIDAAHQKMDEANIRNDQTIAAAKVAATQSADVETRRKQHEDDFERMRAGISSRQSALDAQAGTLDQREAKLKTDREAFNARIEALKLPT